MGQRQHHLPQVYLRPWRDSSRTDRRLWRYRRVGPARRLTPDYKPPSAVGFEDDLYTLPPGAEVHGLTGDELEDRLARAVDDRLPDAVARASGARGEVEPSLADELKRLMATFCARDPEALRRAEDEVSRWVAENASSIRRFHGRARTSAAKRQLAQYFDSRMPEAQARSGLESVISDAMPSRLRWLEGAIRLVHLDEVAPTLKSIGLSELPTFEDPVVKWVEEDGAPLATFALSPRLMVMVENPERGTRPDPSDVAFRHIVMPIAYRRNFVCSRSLVPGSWLYERLRTHLLPWDGGSSPPS